MNVNCRNFRPDMHYVMIVNVNYVQLRVAKLAEGKRKEMGQTSSFKWC